MNSLRAESTGMLRALTVLEKLIKERKTIQTNRIVACNNNSLVKRTHQIYAHGTRWNNQVLKPHMDIQLHIDRLIKALNGDIKITNVKGHCDRGKEPLKWIQKLNVRVDELATQQRETI